MLFQHDPAAPIGVWQEMREDARGLFVRGRLMTDVAKGREVLALMRAGAIDGLSIGFRTVRGRTDAKSGRAAAARSGSLGGVGGDVSDAAGGAGERGEGDRGGSRARAGDASARRGRCGHSPSPLAGEGWGGGSRASNPVDVGATPPLTPPRKGEGTASRRWRAQVLFGQWRSEWKLK